MARLRNPGYGTGRRRLNTVRYWYYFGWRKYFLDFFCKLGNIFTKIQPQLLLFCPCKAEKDDPKSPAAKKKKPKPPSDEEGSTASSRPRPEDMAVDENAGDGEDGIPEETRNLSNQPGEIR